MEFGKFGLEEACKDAPLNCVAILTSQDKLNTIDSSRNLNDPILAKQNADASRVLFEKMGMLDVKDMSDEEVNNLSGMIIVSISGLIGNKPKVGTSNKVTVSNQGGTTNNSTGKSPIVTTTDKGKKIYTNPTTGVQVVEDLNGNYFRIYDPNQSGKRAYLDMNGKIPNNKLLENGKEAGRNQGEYNQVTHFNIERK